MVAVEAWAEGVPTAAAEVMGLGETHRASRGGLLFSPEAPDALAGAVCRLLNDRALRRRLGRAGLEWTRQNSDPEIYAKKFRDFLYECALL